MDCLVTHLHVGSLSVDVELQQLSYPAPTTNQPQLETALLSPRGDADRKG